MPGEGKAREKDVPGEGASLAEEAIVRVEVWSCACEVGTARRIERLCALRSR